MNATKNYTLIRSAIDCWPPILAIVSVIMGNILRVISPSTFQQTHGLFEIVVMIGFLAAGVYSFALWPNRTDRRQRFPLYANLGLILPVIVGGAVLIIMNLL